MLYRYQPSAGVPINYNHPHAHGIVSCLLPGRDGLFNLIDPVVGETLTTTSAFTQAQTVLGLAASSSGSKSYNITSDRIQEPLSRASNIGDGAWTILAGVKLGTTSQAKYVYQEGGISSIAVIYGFSAGNYEMFSGGGVTGDIRTGSQIGVSDTNLHLIGYSYGGRGGKEYSKWLDGVKTVIASDRTIQIDSGATFKSRYLYASNSDGDGINAAICFLFIWSGVKDLLAIQSNPFGFFGYFSKIFVQNPTLDLPETLSDQMNNFSDAISLLNGAAADYGAILGDDLNSGPWKDDISLIGGDPDFQLALGDNLQAAFAEGLSLVYSYEEAISDTYDNLSDALGFTVGLPIELFDSNQFNWADFLDFALIGFQTLTLQDDLNNWADFISVLAAAVVLSVILTDQMNNMVDAVSKNIQYRIQLRDIMAMTDQLIARMSHLLTITDQANNMSDVLVSMQYGAHTPFADDLNNMGDSISIALLPADGLTLELSDSMNNMADSWQDSVNPNINLLDYIRAHMNDV